MSLKDRIEEAVNFHYQQAVQLAVERPQPLDIPGHVAAYQQLAGHVTTIHQLNLLLAEPESTKADGARPVRERTKRLKQSAPAAEAS